MVSWKIRGVKELVNMIQYVCYFIANFIPEMSRKNDLNVVFICLYTFQSEVHSRDMDSLVTPGGPHCTGGPEMQKKS